MRDQFRYGNYVRDIRVTEPQIAYRGVTDRTPLGQITVNRNIIAVNSTETFLQNQSDVTVRFETGPLRHVLVAGVEAGQEIVVAGALHLCRRAVDQPAEPQRRPAFLAGATIASITNSRVNTVAGYAIDTIKLGEQWDLTAGFRYDYLDTKYGQQVAPAVHLQRVDTVPSYRAALAYHPVPGGTLYVAYGTSFNPSADGLTLAVNNAGLAPERTPPTRSAPSGRCWTGGSRSARRCSSSRRPTPG